MVLFVFQLKAAYQQLGKTSANEHMIEKLHTHAARRRIATRLSHENSTYDLFGSVQKPGVTDTETKSMTQVSKRIGSQAVNRYADCDITRIVTNTVSEDRSAKLDKSTYKQSERSAQRHFLKTFDRRSSHTTPPPKVQAGSLRCA